MKKHLLNAVFAVLAAVVVIVARPGSVHAFHNGGAGFCEGCHTMHNSISPGTTPKFSPDQTSINGVKNWYGTPVNPKGSVSNAVSPFLLRGSDDSSTCLNCHAQKGMPYRVLSVDGNVNINPGGDFYWMSLTVTYTALENGISYLINGQDHGHNVVAKDFDMAADTNFTNAPGGDYPSSALMCTSCHDPHGQVNGGTGRGQKPVSMSGSYGCSNVHSGTICGNYRLLGDTHYKGNSLAPYTFSYGAPMAAADNSPAYNFAETADNRHHVDYGTHMYQPYNDMSLWCENCHPWNQFAHHPVAGTSAEGVPLLYNSYIATGNLLNKTSNATGAWLSLVPFERIISKPSQLNGENTNGPTASIPGFPSCLTCHRAHASAFEWSTRWDTRTTFLANSVPGPTYDPNTEYSPYGAYVVNAPYYGRDIKKTFGPYQRQLCNKCHVLDFDDRTGYLPKLY